MFTRFALLAVTLMLVACGDETSREPFLESRAPPSLTPRFYPPHGWAWGLVQVGEAPPQRYGVASPDGVPRAQVLVLTGYGDTAEGWFETVRELTDDGCTVWVLEGAGQGGSGRLSGARDLGHVTSFAPDLAAAMAMMRAVIPASDQTPLILLGEGVGGVTALRAAEAAAPVDGLVLSRLPERAQEPTLPRWAINAGLGAIRAPGGHGWRRDARLIDPSGDDPQRTANQQAWMLANPDLRMGGPSLAWRAAYRTAVEEARRDQPDVKTPTLWTNSTTRPHLARDPARQAWMLAVTRFIDARTSARHSHGL